MHVKLLVVLKGCESLHGMHFGFKWEAERIKMRVSEVVGAVSGVVPTLSAKGGRESEVITSTSEVKRFVEV